ASVVEHFSKSYYKEPGESEAETLYQWIQSYQQRLSASTISREASLAKMQQANPRFILRNYLLHQAIEELQVGNDATFRKLEKAIQEPYTELFPEFFGKRPDWASQKAGCSMLSCSS
ncbi:MAG TPA: protein adenylyltransferase SelO family protein, partial [Flavisolibacter sp.]